VDLSQYAELFLETTASRDPHAMACLARLSGLVGEWAMEASVS